MTDPTDSVYARDAVLSPEDAARADVYGVLARLFYAAPDRALLDALAEQRAALDGDADAPFPRAWRALAKCAGGAEPGDIEEEHTLLFVGAGRAGVTPYLSNYMLRHQSDTPLAELRETLRRMGIARREGIGEYEDHVSGVMETMRHMIAVQHADLDTQRRFFDRFIGEAARSFCEAVTNSQQARFYRFVAALGGAFLDIERSAFEYR